MANKRRTRRGISKHDNDNAGVTKGGVWPREIDSILRLNCFDIWLWQFGKRIFCESIRGWSLNRGGDYRANRGLGILPNCLGVNWLIPRGGNRFFWSSKKCGVIGTVFRSSSWHRKRILVCIIFGLGVSHGPFHLHYAWDLPDFWRGWLAGWLEKNPAHPSICILSERTCLSPPLCPLRRGCVTGSKCPVVSLICKLPSPCFLFISIFSASFHLRLIN